MSTIKHVVLSSIIGLGLIGLVGAFQEADAVCKKQLMMVCHGDECGYEEVVVCD